jgi:hypothetical protein
MTYGESATVRKVSAAILRPLLESTMPAKRAKLDVQLYPEGLAEFELRHNPGHDFLRMLKWCAEATPRKFNAVFAAYSRNPIAILLGAAAIEGYTNYAGHSLCKDWEQFLKGSRAFSTKLKHVFSSCNKSSKLSQRVYQDTMTLVRFRGSLAHPDSFISKKCETVLRQYSLIILMWTIPLLRFSRLQENSKTRSLKILIWRTPIGGRVTSRRRDALAISSKAPSVPSFRWNRRRRPSWCAPNPPYPSCHPGRVTP